MSREVTGFVLTFDDRPDQAAYFSGDAVWFEGVGEVARKEKGNRCSKPCITLM